MNQRLQELYLDAVKHMEMVQQQGLPAPYQTRALAEKFAELIVQECASICYKSSLLDADAHAQNLLYEFNIDNCRNQK